MMKTKHTDLPGRHRPATFPARWGWPAMAAVLLGLFGCPLTGDAQESAPVAGDVQVLTRGPIHEAFSGMLGFNPEPGILVAKSPPENITEIPPEEIPEGENVTWIPGYWGWDDERDDFLWVSGIWRALPPDREWIAGYWLASGTSYQWTSGYWRNRAETETVYLPPPPATLERGPNVAAPSADYGWSPGNWLWRDNRYAWQPGYWYQGRNDWVWTPASYVWTPGGYVYVDGYWDYPISGRGVLFAPVYSPSRSYASPDYRFTPGVAIDIALIVENLFLRPKYHHYYFGDYFATPYRARGYYTPYDYQSERRGYDSVFSHQQWAHRDDRGWEDSYRASYRRKFDDKDARPYRLWSDAENYRQAHADSPRNKRMVAESYQDYTRRPDTATRFKTSSAADRKRTERRNQDLRDFRKQRGETETKLARDQSGNRNQPAEAVRVKTKKSPLAGKASRDLRGAKAPPKPHGRAPTDANGKPGADSPSAKDTKRPKPGNQDEVKAQPGKARPDTPKKPTGDQQKARPSNANPKAQPQPGKVRPDTRKKPSGDQQKARPADATPKPKAKPQPGKVRPDTRTKPSADQQKARPADAPPKPKAKPQPGKVRPDTRTKPSADQQKARPADATPKPKAKPQPDKDRRPKEMLEEEAAREIPEDRRPKG